MPEWVEVLQEGGDSYYWNKEGNQVVWELPRGASVHQVYDPSTSSFKPKQLAASSGRQAKAAPDPDSIAGAGGRDPFAKKQSSAALWLGPLEEEGAELDIKDVEDSRSAQPRPGGEEAVAAPAQADKRCQTPAGPAAAAGAAQLRPQITRSYAPRGTNDSVVREWSQRIRQMSREAKVGLGLCSVVWEWERRWPNEKIEDFKPCTKKMKDAVLKYVPGVLLTNDNIWVCEPLRSVDPEEAEVAEARSERIFATPKVQRQAFRQVFESAGWRHWTATYHDLVQQDLFRCTLHCSLPELASGAAGRVEAASSGSSPLAGSWTYDGPDSTCEYDIIEQGPQLFFIEVLQGVEVRGELYQGNDGWREAQLSNGFVRVRWCGEGTVETQNRVSANVEWSATVIARRSLHGTYVGYGPGPMLACCSAMEEAMKDPRLPPPPVPRAQPVAGGAAKDSSHSTGWAQVSSPFAPVERSLEALLRCLTDLRQKQPAPAPPAEGRAWLSPDASSWEDEDSGKRKEIMERFGVLVDGVCSLLAGEKAVPLTQPGWMVTKLLLHTWHYGLALRNLEALRRVSRALQAARSALLEPSAKAASALEDSQAPEADGDAGVPLCVWEELVDCCVSAAQIEGGIAEQALALLPKYLPPPSAHYAAHFLQLLLHERTEELRVGLAEAQATLGEQYGDSVFEGAWSQQSQHRPDIDLALVPGFAPPRHWGLLRKGEVLFLAPFCAGRQLRRDFGAPVELRADFDPCREIAEGELLLLKVKLHSVQLPLDGRAELLRAQTFALAPTHATKVPHDRQKEAVKAICRPGGGVYHTAIRGLVLRSWAQSDLQPRPSPSLGQAVAPQELGSPTPSEFAAEVPEDLEVHARELTNPSPSSLAGTICSVPLTPGQEQAVHFAASRRCTLVRGPPGTGKTHTACAMIGRWCESVRRCRVLVVTQSNAAALNIHQRLEAFGLESVRVGMQLKPEELLQQSYFTNTFDPADIYPLREAVRRGEPPPPAAVAMLCQKAAKRAPVVVMTCIASGNMGLLGSCSFQRVLLDEAAQATEPTSLVPLMSGAAAFACIGDDRQLPATVKTQVARARGLDRSLFERLLSALGAEVAAGDGFVQLDVQRRMHSSIADFPAFRFYGSALSNGISDSDRPPVPGITWPDRGACRVLFVDLAGRQREESSGTSTMNRGEAQLLASTVAHLMQVREEGAVRAQDIAVITGYAAQRDLIRQEITRTTKRSDPARHVRIDTVDGFQGMERELVLVSSTRSNARDEVGFLRDPRRTNVLLTRARRGLIVFGDAQTLKNEESVWEPWLKWVESRGGLIGAQAFEHMQVVTY